MGGCSSVARCGPRLRPPPLLFRFAWDDRSALRPTRRPLPPHPHPRQVARARGGAHRSRDRDCSPGARRPARFGRRARSVERVRRSSRARLARRPPRDDERRGVHPRRAPLRAPRPAPHARGVPQRPRERRRARRVRTPPHAVSGARTLTDAEARLDSARALRPRRRRRREPRRDRGIVDGTLRGNAKKWRKESGSASPGTSTTPPACRLPSSNAPRRGRPDFCIRRFSR